MNRGVLGSRVGAFHGEVARTRFADGIGPQFGPNDAPLAASETGKLDTCPLQQISLVRMRTRANPPRRRAAQTTCRGIRRISIRRLLAVIAEPSVAEATREAAMTELKHRRPERNIRHLIDSLMAAAHFMSPPMRKQLASCISCVSGQRWFPCCSCNCPVGPQTGYCCVPPEADDCWGVHCPYCGARAEYDSGCRHYFGRTADDENLILRCPIQRPKVPKAFPQDTRVTASERRALERLFPLISADEDISNDLWWLWSAMHDESTDTDAEVKWQLVLSDAFCRATPYLKRYDWPPPGTAWESPATGGSSYYFAQQGAWNRAETAINVSLDLLAKLLSQAARRATGAPPTQPDRVTRRDNAHHQTHVERS